MLLRSLEGFRVVMGKPLDSQKKNRMSTIGLGSAPPGTGSPGPFGPGTPEESEKSPEKVPWAGTPRVPEECAPESQKSPKRIQNLTFGLFSDSFETPGRTLRGLGVPAQGTFSGLFSDSSGVPGPGDSVPGGADPNNREQKGT